MGLRASTPSRRRKVNVWRQMPIHHSQIHHKKEIMMKTFNIKLIALALGFAFSTGAMAASMTKADYKASKDTISAEYKTGKAGCCRLSRPAEFWRQC